ncbi:SMI1/KNR4 family protein [Ktedonobacter racemifer]|uniref:Cell wall assembly/cell proliferation coordinating protein, KNR4 n=1 Tax=Ktedonobacter racemifer DSM 44963 TaxID=485913 RepID=D6TX95_KTERA|nr:SMI1/KNR4 family protein [Ktedonobacter racemifer]EFH84828.1 Cell wall assembly/cell proliferation coordinating protein, KNR4 [Ktedonobacter racemifer DSM 44963]
MDETEERLLVLMKALTSERKHRWAACLSEEALLEAEAMLGFPLPSLLRRIYREVGDGAFGLSLLHNGCDECAMSLIESYIELRSASVGGIEERVWPEKLLIIYDHGCNSYSCVDCAHPEHRVLMNDNSRDPNIHVLEAPSIEQWLQRLLDGTLFLPCDWNAAEKLLFQRARFINVV